MAELIEITRALELVKSFLPIERVILTCAGTLQGTLSAYFNHEVTVQVTHQDVVSQQTKNTVINRLVELRSGELVVCEAGSQLTISDPKVTEKVLTQELGIGQILETQGLRPSFTLLEVGMESESFWRKYSLEAPGVSYIITEHFPKWLYRQTLLGRPGT